MSIIEEVFRQFRKQDLQSGRVQRKPSSRAIARLWRQIRANRLRDFPPPTLHLPPLQYPLLDQTNTMSAPMDFDLTSEPEILTFTKELSGQKIDQLFKQLFKHLFKQKFQI
jgi:hypothetical protein